MIGIVILNYNTPKDVKECVSSIIAGTTVDYMIYIVDNCSTDNSYNLLSEQYQDEGKIRVLKSDYNGGYSFGNNIGIKRALEDNCDYILISNPDVIYDEDTVGRLLEVLRMDERIGVVGPSTPSLDQDESQLLRKVYTPSVYFFSKKPFLYLSRILKQLRTEYDYPDDNDKPFVFEGMVRGCCFLIPSELFCELGLFDDNVFLYSEEWILAKKLSDKGLLCAFEPRAKAFHKEATSTKQSGSGFQSFHLYLSAFYYLKYYSGCGSGFLLFAYVQNIVNYILKSLSSNSYRSLLTKFITAQTELIRGKKKTIGFDRMR